MTDDLQVHNIGKKRILTLYLNEDVDVSYWGVVDGSFTHVVSLVALLCVVDDQSVSTLA